MDNAQKPQKPARLDVLLAAAREVFVVGDFPTAKRLLEQCVVLDPKNEALRRNLALVNAKLAEAGRRVGAQPVFTEFMIPRDEEELAWYRERLARKQMAKLDVAEQFFAQLEILPASWKGKGFVRTFYRRFYRTFAFVFCAFLLIWTIAAGTAIYGAFSPADRKPMPIAHAAEPDAAAAAEAGRARLRAEQGERNAEAAAERAQWVQQRHEEGKAWFANARAEGERFLNDK